MKRASEDRSTKVTIVITTVLAISYPYFYLVVYLAIVRNHTHNELLRISFEPDVMFDDCGSAH